MGETHAAGGSPPVAVAGDARRFWAAGGLIPLVMWTLYVAVVAASEGIGWPPELWTGSILWSALLGAALGVLMRPPTTLRAGSATHGADLVTFRCALSCDQPSQPGGRP